jgi:hypothetical protein
VLPTLPDCTRIIGYSGNSDALIALDGDDRILGVAIRSSEDTARYVDDVRHDRTFLKRWDGMSLRKASRLAADGSGVDGVSGATATSRAVSQSVALRLALAQGQPPPPRGVRWNWRDAVLTAVVACACLLAFTRLRGRRWTRPIFQLIVIAYIGFLNGDALSLKLLAGWTRSGVPWESAPGLALLAAAALLIPWGTRTPLYCQQLCPHGAVQEWLFRITRGRFRVQLPRGLSAWLRGVPAVLLGAALVVTMLRWKFELSQLEPFDAYNVFLSSVGWIAVALAGVGLLAGLCVPMAYCKFGCPTGALLEFARRRGARDRFGRRDIAAAILALLAAVMFWV